MSISRCTRPPWTLAQVVRTFSRYQEYILGSELRRKSREVVEVIIKANSTVETLAAPD